MEPNFKSWQKKNTTKSFEDFKKEIGQKKKTSSKTNKPFSLKNRILSAFFILCLFAGTIYGKKLGALSYSLFIESKSSVGELLEKEWKRQYFLNKSISIKAPYFLEKEQINIKLPDFVSSLNNYSYLDGNNFGIVLTHLSYKNNLKNIPLKNASESRLKEMIQKMKGTQLTYTDKEVKVNNKLAILKEGTFASHKNEIHFRTFTSYQKDNNLITLMICWVNKSSDYELLSKRILNSLEIH